MKKVAIFGSARTKPDSNLYKAVEKLGRNIVENGWVVVTGGGPGTMEAANKGAISAKKGNETVSIAQAIYLPFEDDVNSYVEEYERHINQKRNNIILMRMILQMQSVLIVGKVERDVPILTL